MTEGVGQEPMLIPGLWPPHSLLCVLPGLCLLGSPDSLGRILQPLPSLPQEPGAYQGDTDIVQSCSSAHPVRDVSLRFCLATVSTAGKRDCGQRPACTLKPS